MLRWMKRCALVSALALASVGIAADESKELIVDMSHKGQKVTAPKPTVNYAALDKLGWKLGTQAYTWRHISLMETIDMAGNLGLQYIEMYPGQKYSKDSDAKADHNNLSEDKIAEIKKALADKKLVVLNYGVVSVGGNEGESRKVFEFAKRMGIKNIVSEPPRKTLAQDKEMFAMLDRLCEEYHINIALHNHPEPNPYGTPEKVLEVVEGRSKHIGACADLGHWQRSGIKPVDAIKKLEGRILVSHVKDLNEFGKRNAHDVPWGTGVGDLKSALAELKKQGAKVNFSIEYERLYPGMTPDIAKSIQWFSDTATELAKD